MTPPRKTVLRPQDAPCRRHRKASRRRGHLQQQGHAGCSAGVVLSADVVLVLPFAIVWKYTSSRSGSTGLQRGSGCVSLHTCTTGVPATRRTLITLSDPRAASSSSRVISRRQIFPPAPASTC